MADISWTDILNATTGVLTAVFTGWGAYLVWQHQQEKISFEWEEEYQSSSKAILIRGTVRNNTGGTLKAWRVTVDGPVVSVTTNGEKKHESWAAHESWLRCEPAPGSSASFSFEVAPDWEKLHEQATRWHSRLKSWLAKLAWKTFSGSIRVHHGASLHFHIIIDSKSNKRFRRRITQTIWVNPAMIAKRVESIQIESTGSSNK